MVGGTGVKLIHIGILFTIIGCSAVPETGIYSAPRLEIPTVIPSVVMPCEEYYEFPVTYGENPTWTEFYNWRGDALQLIRFDSGNVIMPAW